MNLPRHLSHADHVVLADIYAARETDDLGVSSEGSGRRNQKAREQTPPIFRALKPSKISFAKNCIHGDLLITMGAGDVVNVGEDLLQLKSYPQFPHKVIYKKPLKEADNYLFCPSILANAIILLHIKSIKGWRYHEDINDSETNFRHNATLISNEFIDHYMTEANGEFVKVYLFLLRHLDDSCS